MIFVFPPRNTMIQFTDLDQSLIFPITNYSKTGVTSFNYCLPFRLLGYFHSTNILYKSLFQIINYFEMESVVQDCFIFDSYIFCFSLQKLHFRIKIGKIPGYNGRCSIQDLYFPGLRLIRRQKHSCLLKSKNICVIVAV